MEADDGGLTLRARLLQHTEGAGSAIKRLQECKKPTADDILTGAKVLISQLADCIADAKALAASRDGAFCFKVLNLPAWPQPRVAAWLQRQKITFATLEKEASWKHAVLSVQSQESKDRVMKQLAECQIQGTRLKCTEIVARAARQDSTDISAAQATQAGIKRPAATAGPATEAPKAKQARVEQSKQRDPDYPDDEKAFDIREQLTPLWQMSYPCQLQEKFATVVKRLDGITLNLARRIGDAGILRSPASVAYRNSADFTIGLSPDGKPAVGYLYGRYTDGFTAVANPKNLANISPVSKGYALLLTSFLRSESSKLPVWNKADNHTEVAKRGFWRHLCVREGRRNTFFGAQAASDTSAGHPSLSQLDTDRFLIPALHSPAEDAHAKGIQLDTKALAVLQEETEAPALDDVALLLQVNPEYSTKQAMETELEAFVAFLRSHKPRELPAPSVCVIQEHALCGNGAPPDAKMYPAPGFESCGTHFSDAICNFTFKLEPTSFFQVNSAAAASLFKLAGEWAAPSNDAVLLDLYCGCGSFGITLSHRVRHVIGVDNNPCSIKSATEASAANGLQNCRFVTAAVESKLPELLQWPEVSGAGEVVAIVDPPRGGLMKGAIFAILGEARISRIVYVSCNPETLLRDVVDFAMPPKSVRRPHKATRREPLKIAKEPPKDYLPFQPIKCIAVDMFPQTRHVEAILLLERHKTPL